jgi:hypothetical protein
MTECNKCCYPLVGGTCDNGCEQSENVLVLMPRELTAENGAKALLIGEFHVETQVPNPDYDEFLDDEDEEPQFFTQQIPVPWDTIKKIYAKAVEHLAKPVVEAGHSAFALTAEELNLCHQLPDVLVCISDAHDTKASMAAAMGYQNSTDHHSARADELRNEAKRIEATW